MMNGGLTLKLCDFGTACDKRTLMTLERGTPFWLAPEQMTSSILFLFLVNINIPIYNSNNLI